MGLMMMWSGSAIHTYLREMVGDGREGVRGRANAGVSDTLCLDRLNVSRRLKKAEWKRSENTTRGLNLTQHDTGDIPR